MKWTCTSNRPLTIESRVEVENEHGEKGHVSVAWKDQRPILYGPVTQATSGTGIDEHGEPFVRVRVLDEQPTF